MNTDPVVIGLYISNAVNIVLIILLFRRINDLEDVVKMLLIQKSNSILSKLIKLSIERKAVNKPNKPRVVN